MDCGPQNGRKPKQEGCAPPPARFNQTVPFLSDLYVGFCGISNSASETVFRSLKNSDLAQLPHFTGGETEAQREVIKVRRGFMAGLGQASGLLGLSFCCFWSDAALSPQGRHPFILASAVPLICAVTSYKSFPLWSQFLQLNLRDPGVCCPLQGLPPEMRNLGLDLRKTTERVMIRVCCRNSQDIGEWAEEI